MTAAALAERLGVSPRTLYRDIAELRAEGAPIQGEAGLGYVLARGFFLPPLALTEEEADAMLLGLHMVIRRTDVDLAAAAGEALAKLLAVLPAERNGPADDSGLLVPATASGAAPPPGRAPAVLAQIRRALRREQRLRLAYADKAGAATLRIIWPLAVGFFNTVEVLVAWCELRQEFRHFRLDRIGAAETLAGRMPRRRRDLLAEWRAAEGVSTADRN